VSTAAGELEEALAEHEAGEGPFDAQVRDALLAALGLVRAAADQELASFNAAAAAAKNEGGGAG
jgi:hypothetical protein